MPDKYNYFYYHWASLVAHLFLLLLLHQNSVHFVWLQTKIYEYWVPGRNLGFPGGSVVKNLHANAEDVGSIPGLGRFLGEGSSNPLQYSCLENLMDRGAWQGHKGVQHDNLATEQQRAVGVMGN